MGKGFILALLLCGLAESAHAADQTLFTTLTPALLNVRDGSINYELGMRFTSTNAGQIRAISIK